MRSKSSFNRSHSTRHTSRVNERGFLTLLQAIALGISLLIAILGTRFGFPFLDGATAGRVKTCITDVKAALQDLKEERAEEAGAPPKELGWDDPRVQIIERCRTLLAQISNDLRGNGTTGFTNRGNELTNLIPDTLDGFTISNRCSLEDPPVGTAGKPYIGPIRAHIPFGPTKGTATLNMTGAVGGQSVNFRQIGDDAFNWSGTFKLTKQETAPGAGKTSSVNLFAETTVLNRNGNPFNPVSSGIACPLGSTLQPGTNTCKVTCSASKSFTWEKPLLPKINAFVVSPLTINEATPPPFIVLVWNVKDAESVSIDQGVGPVDHKGFYYAFPPLEDTTFTLTATGKNPEDTQTAFRTVKVRKQCSGIQQAGGDTSDIRKIELGRTSGTFQFDYETFDIKDRMIVSYEAKALFDTRCVGESGSRTLTYSGSSTQVTVVVIPNCAGGTTGTAWTYTVHCPLP